MLTRVKTLVVLVVLWAAPVLGQQPAQTPLPTDPIGAEFTTRICGDDVPSPPRRPDGTEVLPPAGSGPVLYQIAPCFEEQGGASLIEPETYLYYIQLKDRLSLPSQNKWVPWDEAAEKDVHDDFTRLWGTNFLENLWIEKEEYTFSNGVVGELITYHMEERQRVKIVDYVGSKAVEISKIDEALKMSMSEIRLDTFIDPALVRKVSGIVRDMMKDKGFQSAEVTPEIVTMEGGPKLVHLTFHMSEGPKVKIKKIEFTGNKVFSDSQLKKHMKENREVWMFSFINGR